MFSNFAGKTNKTEQQTEKQTKTDFNKNSDIAVAMAAVRDLQTQQSLRLGAPLATKSVLLIRAVQKVSAFFFLERAQSAIYSHTKKSFSITHD